MSAISICCRGCGCTPWVISKCETAIHLIPLVGAFTALFTLACTVKKVHNDYVIQEDLEEVSANAVNFPLAESQTERYQRKNRQVLLLANVFYTSAITAIAIMVISHKPMDKQ
jgi:hypothetical protein